jgi:hypothetical protein
MVKAYAVIVSVLEGYSLVGCGRRTRPASEGNCSLGA